MVGTFSAWILGANSLLILPFGAAALTMPRKMAHVQFFTYHAELLPHSEQVVFHKVGLFGSIQRHYVDIKNLEKVDAATLPSALFW